MLITDMQFIPKYPNLFQDYLHMYNLCEILCLQDYNYSHLLYYTFVLQ